MNIEQALNIIDQLISLAPVTRAAHSQGIEAMKVIHAAVITAKIKQEEVLKKKGVV